MHRPTFDCAVQIDDVQKTRSFGEPMVGRCHGIVEIDRFAIHLALKQPHTAAVFEIDGGDNLHDFNWPQRSGRSSPKCASRAPDFSPDETGKRTIGRWQYLRRMTDHSPSWSRSTSFAQAQHKTSARNKHNRRS